MKILLTADLHLGRSSSGLPPSAENLGIPTSSREAWLRMVDMAVREKVDAVLIAGDLVESSTAYYEAMGPLIEGFRKLQESGIDVFAVAGNHDASAFEKIAQEVEDMEKVHFIGRRGNWERVPLIKDGSERLWVDGWSFPSSRHLSNPVDDYAFTRPGPGPVIGLLHGDLDVSASPYAPLSSISLRGRTPDFWLLGHVHKPGLLRTANQANILYPGSPQAMDFGETGPHGIWLLDTDVTGLVPVQWQISSVRYEDSIRLDLSQTNQADDIERKLLGLCRGQIDGLSIQERHELRCVVHRCSLLGEFDQPEVISTLTKNLPEFASPVYDGIHIRYEGSLRDLTTLPLDLQALEQRGGALGQLASRFTQLGSNEWRKADWFENIHTEVLAAYRACPLEGDDEPREGQSVRDGVGPPDMEQTREWLLVQTKKLLVAAREVTS